MSAQGKINAARKAFEAGDLASARREAEAALANSSEDAVAMNLLGMIAVKEEKFSEAISLFRKLLKESPDDVNLNVNMGLAAYKADELALASKHLDLAVKKDAGNKGAHNYLGFVHSKQKNYDRAIIEFKKSGNQKMAEKMKEKIAERDQAKMASPAKAPAPSTARPESAPLPVDLEASDDLMYVASPMAPEPEPMPEPSPEADYEPQAAPEAEADLSVFGLDEDDEDGLDLPPWPGDEGETEDEEAESMADEPELPKSIPFPVNPDDVAPLSVNDNSVSLQDLYDDDDSEEESVADEDVDDGDADTLDEVLDEDDALADDDLLLAAAAGISRLVVSQNIPEDSGIHLLSGTTLAIVLRGESAILRNRPELLAIGLEQRKPAHKRYKNKAANSLFGGDDPFVEIEGEGSLLLGPDSGHVFSLLELYDEKVYLTDNWLFALGPGLNFENGKLANKDIGASLSLVQVSGTGVAVLCAPQSVSAYPAQKGERFRVDADNLVGWRGKLAPKLTASTSMEGRLSVLFAGSGEIIV